MKTASKFTRSEFSVITLLSFGAIAGASWIAELHWRSGWPGLAWLDIFHWAVPLSVALFIGWTAYFVPVHHRTAFIFALLVFAVMGYFVTFVLISAFFGRFGAPLIAIPIWPLIPIAFCLLCRFFGVPISRNRIIFSPTLFTLSWPIAAYFIGDLIHALKSGLVIPFLFVSLGIPLVDLPPNETV